MGIVMSDPDLGGQPGPLRRQIREMKDLCASLWRSISEAWYEFKGKELEKSELATVVGFVVAAMVPLMAIIIGISTYARRIVDAPQLGYVVGSITAILAPALYFRFRSKHRILIVAIIFAPVIVIPTLTGAVLAGAWWVQTEPGRSAAHTVDSWPVDQRNRIVPSESCVTDAGGDWGSGKVCTSGRVLTIWLHSNKSALEWASDSPPAVSGQWYAQVDMRLLQGPPDAVCMLMFGFHAPSHWYALRVQGEQPGTQGGSAGVSQFEGTYPGRFYSGPTVQRSIDLNSWTSVAIKANGNSYDFFVNKRLVAHDQVIDGVQGSVNIGTLAPGSEYRTTEACQFRGLIVRQR